jgi:hypothetical protein
MSGAWEQLFTSALLGTERQPLPAAGPADDPMVHAAYQSAGGPESQVLSVAALLGTARRGVIRARGPQDDVEPGAVCDKESQALASQQALQLLDVVLSGSVATGGQHDELLGQWLDGCSRHTQRIKVEQILGVLEQGSARREIREAASVVVGARGRYIARHNPRWSWVGANIDRKTVSEAETSAKPEEISVERFAGIDSLAKVDALRSWRSVDAAATRLVIQHEMGAANAADRVGFISALDNTLSDEDEGLLEAALDDRGKSVRERARSLLRNLTGSAFHRRMTARMQQLVTVNEGRQLSIDVSLPGWPEDPEEAASWVRDGVGTNQSKRVSLLENIAAMVPTLWWETTVGRPIHEVVVAISDADTVQEVLAAIIANVRHEAGYAHSAPHAQSAALSLLTMAKPIGKPEMWIQHRSDLLGVLNSQTRVALIDDVTKNNRYTDEFRLLMTYFYPGTALPNHVAERIAKQLMQSESDPAKRGSTDLASWLPDTQGFAAVVRALSSPLQTALSDWSTPDQRIHKRIRHLIAAASISAAIAKEFP